MERVRGYARRKGAFLLVADAAGEVVGMALWTPANDERVGRLYEGRGFGRTGTRLAGESGEPIVLYERPL